jgi:hypothetical protein
MSVVYLAGPIDYGTHDGEDRQLFIQRVGKSAIIYDATATFVAPGVSAMTKQDMSGAISIHHAAIESCDLFVADMRNRSVGIPIEMWVAHEMRKPIVVLYERDLPLSLYIEYVAHGYAYDWNEMAELVESRLFDLTLF